MHRIAFSCARISVCTNSLLNAGWAASAAAGAITTSAKKGLCTSVSSKPSSAYLNNRRAHSKHSKNK